MIRFDVKPFDRDEWTGLITGLQGLSLLQTWEYGEAKAAGGPWRVERGVFLSGGEIIGAVQAMVRPLPLVGGGLVWINRGPLWRRDAEDRVGEMLRLAGEAWLARRFYVRAQPPLLCVQAQPPLPSLSPVPGFQATGRAGWASALIDLTLPEETLRRQLGQKWRNVLNKAERQPLTLRIGDDAPEFEAFLAAHGQFLDGRGFATSLTPELLRRLREFCPREHRPVSLLASMGEDVVGSVLIGRYGDTAEYLSGNLSDEGRKAGAGQLLLWRALCDAKARGAVRFDLGGMDDARTPPGIYRFKAETGGAPYRLAEEIEAARGDPLSRLVRWRARRALAD
ncbi:MAG: GNAT family N-acetyltransferase [Alphaproteobacteria bacterium]|nr:GNAT family N-acetyltransferase [Alphaproteobacteria bacterium]